MTEQLPSAEEPAGSNKSGSQTLDRGIRILEVLAEAGGAMSVANLAQTLGIDRAITYRMLRTLAAHRLVVRHPSGHLRLGSSLLTLAQGVSSNLQAVAGPELTQLAKDLGATAFITVDESGEAVCLAAVEPPRSHVHVVYRPGLRHALDRGGSGIALLAGRPPLEGERPEITAARAAGFAVSQGEIQPGAIAVAAPVRICGGDAIASVAVVSLIGALDRDIAVPRILAAAAAISAALS